MVDMLARCTCLLYRLASCPIFGGGGAQPSCTILVPIVVNLYTAMPRTITSFDSQTPVYITVSLSDEYPIPSIVFLTILSAGFYLIQALPAQ